jgi:hypothetical protein
MSWVVVGEKEDFPDAQNIATQLLKVPTPAPALKKNLCHFPVVFFFSRKRDHLPNKCANTIPQFLHTNYPSCPPSLRPSLHQVNANERMTARGVLAIFQVAV